MPEISADFKTYTVRLREGVFFADDAVFAGKPRELTAQDVVYTYKRIFDPKNKSPSLASLKEEKILGLDELLTQAKETGRFDYDKPIEGLRAVDRYTVQFKLGEVRPRFIASLSDPGVLGIVAREVVEHYGERIMEHPVGTGAFRLGAWRRSSKITLERNRTFREEVYDAEPAADDAVGQGIARQFKGRRLPMIDRVEVSIVEEEQPRWLAFLGNEMLDHVLPDGGDGVQRPSKLSKMQTFGKFWMQWCLRADTISSGAGSKAILETPEMNAPTPWQTRGSRRSNRVDNDLISFKGF
jgi:ABC-type transport system substrate-binding protein